MRVTESFGIDTSSLGREVSDSGHHLRRVVRSRSLAARPRPAGLDILVNNAGIAMAGGTEDLPIDDWDRTLDVNLRGVFTTTKRALPHLKQSPAGRIINIASVNSFRGGLGPAYTASKAGVMNLTRDLAVEVGGSGVTANAICPGAIETAVQDFLGDKAEQLCEAIQAVTPISRMGTPRDIGRACVFLASDDAAWVTGIALPVDGGLLCGVDGR